MTPFVRWPSCWRGCCAPPATQHGATVYAYIDGYSDESVAKEIGRNCTVAHLVRYRQKSLGRIESEVKWPKPATATSTPTGLETRLDSLAERVAALEASIGG